MKVPMQWIRQYTDIPVTPEEFESAMIMHGTGVEGLDNQNDAVQNVVVGKILSVRKHENSDHMVICSVDVGEDAPIQIVTGAPNVHEGDLVPVAKVGAVLPGGVKIKKGKLRGVLSMGMFCSTDELGLTPEGTATGIMILDEGTPIGVDICEVLGLNEDVVEFEITSNRPDCFSIIGLARETAATFDREFHIPDPSKYPTTSDNANDYAKVVIEDYELCPRYLGKVVKNVKIGPSPEWMQRRLNACGIRAINNIVDITNYVMMAVGQPLHAFDKTHVSGEKIIVRNAKENEKLLLLDNNFIELSTDDLVICDESDAMALAGIKGGKKDSILPDTKGVVLEVANFSADTVRQTDKKFAEKTEKQKIFKYKNPRNA